MARLRARQPGPLSAFRAAVTSAPSLDVQVPTCPEWTLFDLARHIGEGRRAWAATVAAGAAPAKSVPEGAPAAPRARGRAGLVGRVDAGIAGRTAGGRPGSRLLDVVGCVPVAADLWRRRPAPAPADRGAHLRRPGHRGCPEPLPDEVALDGVEGFPSTCVATTSAWPHKPATIDFHATEGHSWRLSLSADGARVPRLPAPGTMPATTAGEDRTGPPPPPGARPATWSSPRTAVFRWTPWRSTATGISSTCSRPGGRRSRT
jgi:hypothetical protein